MAEKQIDKKYMKKLEVTLKQHTPLLHFQHWQEGATLRAAEVKPKLDRFLIDKMGGIGKVPEGWKVGSGEHPALDYKMRFEAGDKQEIQMGVFLIRGRGKWGTKPFPSVLSNMGGKETKGELINFSMFETVSLTITCFKDNGLYELLRDNLALFFARHNFGQRSSKGFGSFTVAPIGSEGIDTEQCFEDVLFMDYKVDEGARPYATQKTVMGIIEIFWKKVKKSIKEDHGIMVGGERKITTIQQYVKEMATFRPDSDSRMPSPVFFKPVRYRGEDGKFIRIYIMPDSAMLKRIDNESADKRNISIKVGSINYAESICLAFLSRLLF